ncbi:hypothetical protein N7468_009166 [Penicillium chermesinum]|uniref:Uncharacterized protein n=1 Tax=Penicillium chermesinum TaxID=63820 RepID=A0A9W9TEK9_9EURO|nr:uncharacterized protein N7468_009166 [Penicillium chermesinum]KAJ5219962.1 hypothetical protein N7468_009166 [Penicillium chermesinum]
MGRLSTAHSWLNTALPAPTVTRCIHESITKYLDCGEMVARVIPSGSHKLLGQSKLVVQFQNAHLYEDFARASNGPLGPMDCSNFDAPSCSQRARTRPVVPHRWYEPPVETL